jgi:hypothetical protein
VTAPADPQRAHRVAYLRADEVVHLAGERPKRGHEERCPHLTIFHNRGRTIDGEPWHRCTIQTCGYTHIEPSPYSKSRKEWDEIERANLTADKFSIFLAGLIAGIVGTMLLGWWVA